MHTFHDILQPGGYSGGRFQPGAQDAGSFHDLSGPGVADIGSDSFQTHPMRGRESLRPPRSSSRGRGGHCGGRSGKLGTSTGRRDGGNNIPPPNVPVWSYSVDENAMSSFCSLQLLVWSAIFALSCKMHMSCNGF
jgi:hypothetical protein